MTLLVRQVAGPNPLNAQGRFAPTMGVFSVGPRHGDSNPRTGDMGEGFWTEFERHSGFDGQKIERRADCSDVCWFAHE